MYQDNIQIPLLKSARKDFFHSYCNNPKLYRNNQKVPITWRWRMIDSNQEPITFLKVELNK